MKCSLGISNFLQEISHLSHSIVFLYFFALITYLSLLVFGTLLSNGYIVPFLLCFSFLLYSQLFVRPPQTAILPFCWNAVLGCNLKIYRIISLFPRQTIQYHLNDPTTDAQEAEVYQLYGDLQYLLELTSKKDILFNIGGWNVKGGSQEIPEVQGSLALEYKMKQGKG